MIGVLFNGFYKTYREAREIIMAEIRDGVLLCGSSLFIMIFMNMVIDWPAAGFFKVTLEFENRKFMT